MNSSDAIDAIYADDDLDALDIDPTQFFNMKRGNPFNEGSGGDDD